MSNNQIITWTGRKTKIFVYLIILWNKVKIKFCETRPSHCWNLIVQQNLYDVLPTVKFHDSKYQASHCNTMSTRLDTRVTTTPLSPAKALQGVMNSTTQSTQHTDTVNAIYTRVIKKNSKRLLNDDEIWTIKVSNMTGGIM